MVGTSTGDPRFFPEVGHTIGRSKGGKRDCA
jgi:hypothetical protein